MIQIKSNLPVNGIHWGLKFANGIAETDNAPLAEKLARKGYTVQDMTQPEPKQPEPEQPEPEQPEIFTCPKCGKVYKSRAGLTRHLKTCEG